MLATHVAVSTAGSVTEPSSSQAFISAAVLEVYEQPDRDEQHAGLYNFAKSLECIESALMGGFYYKHYLLVRWQAVDRC